MNVHLVAIKHTILPNQCIPQEVSKDVSLLHSFQNMKPKRIDLHAVNKSTLRDFLNLTQIYTKPISLNRCEICSNVYKPNYNNNYFPRCPKKCWCLTSELQCQRQFVVHKPINIILCE